jgi:hypothetical protein
MCGKSEINNAHFSLQFLQVDPPLNHSYALNHDFTEYASNQQQGLGGGGKG